MIYGAIGVLLVCVLDLNLRSWISVRGLVVSVAGFRSGSSGVRGRVGGRGSLYGAPPVGRRRSGESNRRAHGEPGTTIGTTIVCVAWGQVRIVHWPHLRVMSSNCFSLNRRPVSSLSIRQWYLLLLLCRWCVRFPISIWLPDFVLSIFGCGMAGDGRSGSGGGGGKQPIAGFGCRLRHSCLFRWRTRSLSVVAALLSQVGFGLAHRILNLGNDLLARG